MAVIAIVVTIDVGDHHRHHHEEEEVGYASYLALDSLIFDWFANAHRYHNFSTIKIQ